MTELLINIYSKNRYYKCERMVNKIHSSHVIKSKTIPVFVKAV